MDIQNQRTNQQPIVPSPSPVPLENGMTTAAYITAIMSCVSVFVLPVYLPFIFGSISIVLALLSKGSRPRLSPKGRVSMTLSVCSLGLNVLILFLCIYFVAFVPEFRAQFNQAYEQIYGESFDDVINDFTE